MVGSLWSWFCLFAAPIVAGTLAGITLPDSMDVNGQQLVLNGMALRKKVIFKVYVAGLYLPAKEQNGEKILAADGPRCTVMHFLRSVSAKQVNEAWYDGLEANTPGYSAQLKAAVRCPGRLDGRSEGRRQAGLHLQARASGPRSRSRAR